ncbi:MAG: hypothetical protein IT453_09290 [Planctomycetes bacterium]|nr:hypothetical protein [Planctomycetota bacterium]
MRPRPSIRALACLWLAALAFLASPARAQCLPDGLDGGPCCVSTFPTLPAFPPMNLQTVRFVCFDKCKPIANLSLCAGIGAPTPKQFGGAFLCGNYDIQVRVRQCGLNMTLWNGKLNATYSRNWQASSVAGAVNLTVWRFIVNGDMVPTINLPNNPTYRPACQPFTQGVYFTGYIDYAYDCIANTWQVAWMLDHECDGVHHAPGTARPAPATGYHPTRSFNFIGPGAGFVVSAVNPLISNGPIQQGAVRRNDWSAAPMICNFEERAQGMFAPIADYCECNSTGNGQYNMSFVQASGVCNTKVSPSPIGNLNQKRLGSWTNPNVYPGMQTLLFDFGYLDYTDGCTGVQSSEWFEGAETIGGFPAIEFSGVQLGRQFEDLGSANLSATAPTTFIGAPHVVYYLLNFNLP